jgi:DNA-binding transcriptional ArsR family regulator
MSDEVVADRALDAMRSNSGVEHAAAMRHLPAVYSLALRLREAGLADDLIAECLAVEREAFDPLWDVAEAKLAAIIRGEHGR